eukprot:TRINITY_DN18193_c0_g1_i1.p2 TRINITY_DN18193_c0_g1~~TRINITY_DN18193_c0_g1_i1.p2  ORF type:complete len:206 (-),score=51.84 TRINITY_DN18193_c0_g1_i1:216-833(-)
MIRRPPRSTQGVSSAASDVYKRQGINAEYMGFLSCSINLTFNFKMEDGDVAAAGAGPVMDVQTAVKEVLKKAAYHDTLVRGLREAVKALDKRQAVLCVLADSLTEPAITVLVEALCAEHEIPLIKVADPKTLGEWAGLCKIDREGEARKVVGCSCVVLKGYGEESEALTVLQEHLKQQMSLVQGQSLLTCMMRWDFMFLESCVDD